MKRIILILITILTISPNIYSQNTEISFNKGFGFEIGYSNIYNTVNDHLCEPKHLLTADMTIWGVYIGMGIGSKHLYSEYGYNYDYTESINTFILRGGPVLRIGNWKHGLNITPYIGCVWNNYSDDYYYYDIYNHITYNYNKVFLYGARLTYTYNYISISANISNHDVGVAIGFYVAM